MKVEFSQEAGAWLGFPPEELDDAISVLDYFIQRGKEEGQDTSQAEIVRGQMFTKWHLRTLN